jgi:hypothetical protein
MDLHRPRWDRLHKSAHPLIASRPSQSGASGREIEGRLGTFDQTENDFTHMSAKIGHQLMKSAIPKRDD